MAQEASRLSFKPMCDRIDLLRAALRDAADATPRKRRTRRVGPTAYDRFCPNNKESSWQMYEKCGWPITGLGWGPTARPSCVDRTDAASDSNIVACETNPGASGERPHGQSHMGLSHPLVRKSLPILGHNRCVPELGMNLPQDWLKA